MATIRTVLVTGATGAQGGGVADHLLRAGSYRVRCLTRSPDSQAARALRDRGAEVVQGDMDDVDSLTGAMSGCEAAFCVTNFWEHFDRERQHGMNLVVAVDRAKLTHAVFSTLPSPRQSDPALNVPHFEIKAEVEQAARQRSLAASFVHVAFYYENFLSFFPPRKQEDGSYAFGFPQGDTPLAAVAVEDVGGVVRAIFDRHEAFIGKTVGVVGDDRPAAEYARILSEAIGVPIVYNHIPRDVFADFGFPGAADLAHMFDYNRRFLLDRSRDLQQSRQLHPQIQDFHTWARSHRDALKAALQ
jgi:uncharacterized protein YbjT (DUF2867 family)